MATTVFVDGQAGTTGLEIHDRLAGREDIQLLQIAEEKRKDPQERAALLNQADIAFLCLPDQAAREAVAMVTNDRTRVIDASTAHRTDPAWVYGIPELEPERRQAIAASRRVSVPGCHASGFTVAVYPLLKNGFIPPEYPFSCTSLTGYSGGGKTLIRAYQEPEQGQAPVGPRHYALSLNHKHLPELQGVNLLPYPPLFSPVVADFYRGMVVSVPLFPRLLPGQPSAEDIHSFLHRYYKEETFIQVMPFNDETVLDKGFLDPTGCNHTNRLDLFVFGNESQILLCSRLDNLGKGASGAAVQNMNIMLGIDEATGLQLQVQ